MKCTNCGFESQEGANRCRRCGEPLVAADNDSGQTTTSDDGFVDFSQDQEFTDFSQESPPSDAAMEPPPPPPQQQQDISMMQPPLQMPQAPHEEFPTQTPAQPPPQTVQDFSSYGAPPTTVPPTVRQKKPRVPDPDAEYIDNYTFPTTPLINEILFGKSGATDPSVFFTAMIAILLSLFFYKVFPVPTSTGYFHDLFTDRGTWPYVSVFFLWWAICLEVNKLFRYFGQSKVLKTDLFPAEFKKISFRNACKLQRHILQLYPNPHHKVVTNRMWVALQQFRNLGHMEEVNDLVEYQAEIDLSNLESSYSFLNLLIWAHPIVGFLGTVVGIGTAIGGFSKIIESAIEIDAIKGALQVVTGGLSTAFDTTLIGLVFAMILMFTSIPLKKMEEDFLGEVENFTIRQLLNRMIKTNGLPGEDEEEEEELDEGDRVRRIIEETFQNQLVSIQGAFQSWQSGFSSMVNQISQESQSMGQQFSAVTPIVTDFRKVISEFSGQMKDTANQQRVMLKEMSVHVQKVAPVVGGFQKAMEGMDAQRQMISNQLADWAKNFDQLGEGITGRFSKMGDDLGAKLDKMAEGNVSRMEKTGGLISESLQKTGTGFTERFDKLGSNMVDKLGKVSSSFISEIEKHGKDQNTSLARMNEEVTKEISRMSGDLIGKLEKHIGVFEEFQKNQMENMNAQSQNMGTLSTSITGEFTRMSEAILSKLEGQVTTFQKFSDQYGKYMSDLMGGVSKEISGLTEKILQQFQGQLSTWFSDFTKEQTNNLSRLTEIIGKDMSGMGENVISNMDRRLSDWIQNTNKEFAANIGNVSAALAKEVGGIGEDITRGLERSSQKIINDMGEIIKEQSSAMEKIIKGFENVNGMASTSYSENVHKFESLSKLLSNLGGKQDKVVEAVNHAMQQMSSNEGLQKKSLDELIKSISSQAEMIRNFNTGIDKVANTDMIKDTLEGIRSGIETIKPELKQLASNINEVTRKSG